jgi:DNA-binding response OmpR family regulator
MGSDRLEDATVLAVEDEPDLREMDELMLGDEFAVRTAESGQDALASVDGSVDVVLLDRHMPGMEGDEVLETLRDRGYDLPVAMVTAVEPGGDIVDMPFDAYLTKPVRREELVTKVGVLVNRARFDEKSRELYRLATKKATLESQDTFDHAESEEYAELVERMERLRAEIDETVGELFEEEPEQAFEGL